MTHESAPVGMRTWHSRLYRMIAIGIGLVSLIWFIALLAPVGHEFRRDLPLLMLLVTFAYAGLWRPHVRISDTGIELVNVTHRVFIPWSAVIMIETQFSLGIRTPHRIYHAWAVSAPGRPGPRRMKSMSRNKSRADDSDAAGAIADIEETWREMLDSDRVTVGQADHLAITRRPNVGTIALLALLLAVYVAQAWFLA